MSRMNYEKRNQAGLIRKSHQPTYVPKTRWLPIGFGDHYGKTMPQLLFYDPEYLGHLRDHGIIKQTSSFGIELARQVRVVCNRAENFRATLRFGKKHEFVSVIDGHGVFDSVLLLPKGGYADLVLAKGSAILKRSGALSVFMVLDSKNSTLGFRRMAKSLRKIFISRSSDLSAIQQCERIMERDENFDLRYISQDAFL